MNSDSNKEYSVNWKNHMSHVRKAFDHLLTSNELTDVTLCCEGKKIGAHKMLLSACSSYFRDTFKDVPCQHPVIILYGVEYRVLSDILHFIYNGEVSVDTSKLDSFLKTAQLLQISGLTDGASDKVNDSERVTEASSADQGEESYTEPITSNAVNEEAKKGVKRSRIKEHENRDKVAKQDNDTMLISDVKCEPSELVSFEDPLEDPLLQADPGENREFFANAQERVEEDFKRSNLEQDCSRKHVLKEYSSKMKEKGHYQEKIPLPTNFKRKSYYLNCVMCRRQQIRKQTSWRCRDCPQNPALCPGLCFENWHE